MSRAKRAKEQQPAKNTEGNAPLAAARRPARPSRSLRADAYETIRDRIISGDLGPGDYLNEAMLCKHLGIGRTPVNQALHRLMLEKLVVIMPRKGVFVRPLSIDEAVQIAEARMINEAAMVRLAAERADTADIADLTQCLEAARNALQQRDTEKMMQTDRRFHQLLARAARQPVLGGILEQLQEQSLRFWFVSLNAHDHAIDVQDEHEAILAAVKAGDADAAEAAIRTHILSFRRNLARRL